MLCRTVLTGMKVALSVLVIVRVEAAPTNKGNETPPFPHLTPPSPVALKPSQYLRQWLLSTKAAGLDGDTKTTDKTTTRTFTDGFRASRSRIKPDAADPDKRDKILKVISALEELHRTMNSTLSSRITVMTRAHGRNSGRKNKVLPVPEAPLKPTTVAPDAAEGATSRTSADMIVPSLTGRNFKKSLPPQAKKTNKRVCFWKYCSQN